MSFLSDLNKIDSLEIDKIKIMCNYLEEIPLNEPIDYIKYENFCTANDIKTDIAKSFYRIITFIVDIALEERNLNKAIQETEKITGINFSDEKYKKVWDLIKDNITIFNKFIIYRKERNILNIAPRIQDFKIICDVRPIFNLEKTTIVKNTYPIILKIENSKDEEMIIELSKSELLELKSEIDTAVEKFNLIENK